MSQLFYVMTMPGLETVAFSEIRAGAPKTELLKFSRGITLFRYNSSPVQLLQLRTAEDVFCSLAHLKGLKHTNDALRVIHSATLNSPFIEALETWKLVHHGQTPRTWRVVSQMSGNYEFRRIDAGRSLADALRKVMPRKMRQVDDDADIEIWLWLGQSDVFIGLRLSDATMRHRQYKREHLPASLRPTIAAAMGWLAHPNEQDIVLDPLCGAGTIVIERALLAPLKEAYGGDIRVEAVEMARRNAAAAKITARWKAWDARALPFENASITRIITNLPFGKQIGSREENYSLYGALMQEFDRVVTPEGIIVTLTSEDTFWEKTLRKQGWRTSKKVVLVALGQPASIFVAERDKQ